MKVETQNLEDRQVEMTVEVPEDRLQGALRAAARRVSSELEIPGFRPGKAPYNVVANKVGADYLLDEALDELGQDLYREALETTSLDPFAPGTLNEIVSRQPLVLRYTVPLEPEVDLKDYRQLRIDFEEPVVEDDAVEEVMEQLRQGQALIEPADRPAAMGDVVVVNVLGELLPEKEGGEREELVNENEASLLLEEETDWPIPGISEHLLAKEGGAEVTIEYTFPEDYRNESLRGRQAEFEVTVLEVKSRILPEWTDNLAQNLGDFDDLLSLRLKVRENLQEELVGRSNSEYRDEVMDAILDGAEIVYPPSLLEREIDDMVHDLHRRLERQNVSLADYLEMEGIGQEELREQFEPQAEQRLLRGLILGEVVESEELEVGEEEIEAALDRIVESLGEGGEGMRSQLDNPATRRQIEVDLLTDKAVERLLAIARGQPVPEETEVTVTLDEEGVESEAILGPSQQIDENTESE